MDPTLLAELQYNYEKKKLVVNRDFSKFSCSQSSVCKSERAVQVKGFVFPKESGGWLEKATDRYDV